MKVKVKNIPVTTEVKDAFVRYCKKNGLKIYVSAAEALKGWLEAREAK